MNLHAHNYIHELLETHKERWEELEDLDRESRPIEVPFTIVIELRCGSVYKFSILFPSNNLQIFFLILLGGYRFYVLLCLLTFVKI